MCIYTHGADSTLIQLFKFYQAMRDKHQSAIYRHVYARISQIWVETFYRGKDTISSKLYATNFSSKVYDVHLSNLTVLLD